MRIYAKTWETQRKSSENSKDAHSLRKSRKIISQKTLRELKKLDKNF